MNRLTLGLCLACSLLASQPGLGADITLPDRTVVTVKLADAIDSDSDSFGKHYAAFLTAPISVPGSQTIPAGSRAIVSLVHNNSGWLTQLTGIVVNGRTLEVSSGAGSIIVPGQENKADATSDLRVRMGLTQKAPIVDRVQLASSTQMRFLLIGSSTPARLAPSAARRGSATLGHPLPAVSQAILRHVSGIAYLCVAADTSVPDRTPASYYVADVPKAFDTPAQVEKNSYQFLVNTYPYRFAGNRHVTVKCTRTTDADAGRTARARLEGENADVIRTPWRYTLGPPPVPSSDASGAQPLH